MPGTHNRFHSDGGALAIQVSFCAFSEFFSFQNVPCFEIPPRVKRSVILYVVEEYIQCLK